MITRTLQLLSRSPSRTLFALIVVLSLLTVWLSILGGWFSIIRQYCMSSMSGTLNAYVTSIETSGQAAALNYGHDVAC